MFIKIEISETVMRGLVCDYIRSKLGDALLDTSKLVIEVKSKQNYRSEWEPAAYRATYEGNV